MFLISGATEKRQDLGVARIECPSCRAPRPHRVVRHYRLRRLYFFPLYVESACRVSECGACGATLESEMSISDSSSRPIPFLHRFGCFVPLAGLGMLFLLMAYAFRSASPGSAVFALACGILLPAGAGLFLRAHYRRRPAGRPRGTARPRNAPGMDRPWSWRGVAGFVGIGVLLVGGLWWIVTDRREPLPLWIAIGGASKDGEIRGVIWSPTAGWTRDAGMEEWLDMVSPPFHSRQRATE